MHRIPKNIAPYIVAAAMVFVCPRAALAQLILGFEEKLPPNINAPDLINHGLELSADGLTMYYQIGLNYRRLLADPDSVLRG